MHVARNGTHKPLHLCARVARKSHVARTRLRCHDQVRHCLPRPDIIKVPRAATQHGGPLYVLTPVRVLDLTRTAPRDPTFFLRKASSLTSTFAPPAADATSAPGDRAGCRLIPLMIRSAPSETCIACPGSAYWPSGIFQPARSSLRATECCSTPSCSCTTAKTCLGVTPSKLGLPPVSVVSAPPMP